MNETWEQGIIPKDWKIAVIMPIYKNGHKMSYENYH